MLQSVPDPFDAYGPPQSEDQIFSILAPLSIMTQPTSSSSATSPLTGTPEQETSESLPSSLSSKKVTSWLPTNTSINGGLQTAFPTEAGAWAGVHSPPSTPPCSVSPPHNVSHRYSASLHRKAESKLRSVLSVIEEPRSSRQEGSNASENDKILRQSNDDDQSSLTSNVQNAPPPLSATLDAPNDGSGADNSWSFTCGQSPYEYGYDSNSSTPRNSMLFTSTTVPSDPSNDARVQDSDDQLPLQTSI